MYRLFFFSFILFFLVLLGGCVPTGQQSDLTRVQSERPPQRIIITLPSVVEVFFDIGLGERIVAVSSYTKYPPETEHIEKIGGHLDIDREKIISLKPDLIILPVENRQLRQSISIPVLTVEHNTLTGVLDSYLIIGGLFGADVLATAQKKRQELSDRLNKLEAKTQGRKPIRTLICIDRSRGTGRIQNLFVAGADSFLTEVVAKSGGENAAAVLGLAAPQLSVEGIIHLAPDVIIDIQVDGSDRAQSISDWQSLANSVPAVRNNRILVLTDDFASIPGPRTPKLIEKITQYFESLELE